MSIPKAMIGESEEIWARTRPTFTVRELSYKEGVGIWTNMP